MFLAFAEAGAIKPMVSNAEKSVLLKRFFCMPVDVLLTIDEGVVIYAGVIKDKIRAMPKVKLSL